VNLDYYFDGAGPYTGAMLLGYIAAQLSAMDRKEIIRTRDDLRNAMDDSPQSTAILELIEGHLALRQIKGRTWRSSKIR
jgi:hypothetical protein